MKRILGNLTLGLSGMGFPLTQVVIRRFGTAGAVVVEAVSVGLLVRDVGLVIDGTPRRLRRGPAVLLWLETSAAALASVLGWRLLVDEEARLHALDQRPVGPEIARRLALGALFGMHTMRFRIYLQPDHGLRPEA